MTKGALVLSNGQVYYGNLRGALRPSSGEVIFNTAMTGYQEILTDPSYTGQIVTMTYPHIGNYGMNLEDMESTSIHAAALIVKELSLTTSNWRATNSLEKWLSEKNIPILEGIDTRALVKVLREGGDCLGLVTPVDASFDLKKAQQLAKTLPSMEGQNLAQHVSTTQTQVWKTEGKAPKFRVVAYDFGIKHNILRIMNRLGMEVTVVPFQTPAKEVLARKPDGIFLSNGPGDPAAVGVAIENIKHL